jgi:hypothetical protein
MTNNTKNNEITANKNEDIVKENLKNNEITANKNEDIVKENLKNNEITANKNEDIVKENLKNIIKQLNKSNIYYYKIVNVSFDYLSSSSVDLGLEIDIEDDIFTKREAYLFCVKFYLDYIYATNMHEENIDIDEIILSFLFNKSDNDYDETEFNNMISRLDEQGGFKLDEINNLLDTNKKFTTENLECLYDWLESSIFDIELDDDWHHTNRIIPMKI